MVTVGEYAKLGGAQHLGGVRKADGAALGTGAGLLEAWRSHSDEELWQAMLGPAR